MRPLVHSWYRVVEEMCEHSNRCGCSAQDSVLGAIRARYDSCEVRYRALGLTPGCAQAEVLAQRELISSPLQGPPGKLTLDRELV